MFISYIITIFICPWGNPSYCITLNRQNPPFHPSQVCCAGTDRSETGVHGAGQVSRARKPSGRNVSLQLAAFSWGISLRTVGLGVYFNQALVFVPINTRGLDLSLLVSVKQGDIPSVLLILSLGESMPMLVNVTSGLLSGQDYQVTFQADYTLLYFKFSSIK